MAVLMVIYARACDKCAMYWTLKISLLTSKLLADYHQSSSSVIVIFLESSNNSLFCHLNTLGGRYWICQQGYNKKQACLNHSFH